ncbi:sodium-dependent nutrient amino acid transporter 1 isoform X1 [Anastrepha ludens]|uniref:sodium-dependent nutrient amino acid transporter 1 isoform X1 n=1 Tax=Anastrepha ludens TaxID=28586 RepID=UPI0023B0BC9A|nr:sodium-dependent nutrient amino acid transporter 1 isoform X1 [Anastrepha ludens]XP_053956631.1 sodium-dependent nutrient amino acid transporter 1 isoform X1 [Anastrepha ludens]XP_053956632.1 sodium-dependent nutrient amino acid transporter 1 isoform X1 [Anastrepha ludens]XP_053956634.1 sodium-dependent nutrient amino acid transporter 1 isoform X1 [Anastrepha ludens]
MKTASYRSRSSDEALDEHLKLQRQQAMPMTMNNMHRHISSNTVVPPTPPPPAPMRLRTDSNATSIYVIGADASTEHNRPSASSIAQSDSNPASMERRQHNRLSWVNMHRSGDDDAAQLENGSGRGAVIITPSPQTTRSYISAVSTITATTGTGGGGGGTIRSRVGGFTGGSGHIGNGNGTISGRTTAASGRISTSGATTISGSNNTLNDIISDYHSHEAASGSEFHYSNAIVASTPHMKNLSSSGSFNMANGSTVKLLPVTEDDGNQQTKCSIFRGLVLCICLNVTYANIVRFPRELDKYGSSYLIPYIILLFLVGLPIILLEISVGQFLGQSAAHTWTASPIFKGACIISRFASWLSTIWVSLQAVLAVAYIGMFIFNTMPFRECVGNLKLAPNGYTVTGNSGQECLQRTFLTPFWENPMYFGMLAVGLIGIWIVVMLCTHNGRFLRRSLFFFGILGFALLCCLTGWEVHNSFQRSYFPELWPFDSTLLLDSNIWFNALMQVLFATNCGFGALPAVTGKFLYKGDAVRTSIVYLCFNLLVNAIAATLFMVQFDLSANSGVMIEELKPLTAVYDRVLYDRPSNELIARIIPILIYSLIVISAIVATTVSIYTVTRLVPRHPNYVISLVALVMTIISLAAPKFIIARILDTRVVGTILITALVFELIAICWIYGVKNIYTDLEFSIGRPIFKGWMCLWCICPAILTAALVWWCSDDDQYDLLAEYVPRWAPILLALAVTFIIACVQIFRQVEYNFFGMICEASKPAKEWGPTDPLARHAWKQWRSVCQDTGRRDFTLRRRGTRDYTHSIKKGQYSNSGKYANGHVTQQNWKQSTTGNSSPNYSGSMFGDSAIEEDISVDKFPVVAQQFMPFQSSGGKPLRYSNRSRAQPQQRTSAQQQQHQHREQQRQQTQHQHQHQQNEDEELPLPSPPPPPAHVHATCAPSMHMEKHREIVYIRRLSEDGRHATRIEITPSNESITYGSTNAITANGGARNPMSRVSGSGSQGVAHIKRSSSASMATHNRHSVASVGVGGGGAAAASLGAKLPPPNSNGSADHICWRKFTVNPQEYSTEL